MCMYVYIYIIYSLRMRVLHKLANPPQTSPVCRSTFTFHVAALYVLGFHTTFSCFINFTLLTRVILICQPFVLQRECQQTKSTKDRKYNITIFTNHLCHKYQLLLRREIIVYWRILIKTQGTATLTSCKSTGRTKLVNYFLYLTVENKSCSCFLSVIRTYQFSQSHFTVSFFLPTECCHNGDKSITHFADQHSMTFSVIIRTLQLESTKS